jgi:hypothetical protein
MIGYLKVNTYFLSSVSDFSLQEHVILTARKQSNFIPLNIVMTNWQIIYIKAQTR